MMPIEVLANIVKYKVPCRIQMRSAPEMIFEGPIENFDVQCVPSMLVVNNGHGRKVLNMEDIALIAELPKE